MSSQSRYRNLEIDVLRGFAIIAILLLHVGVMTPGLDEYPNFLILVQRLSTGMQLFFVLSGYLVASSLDRCIFNGEGVKGFLIRRAAKLLPLYFLFLHIHIGLFLIIQEIAPDLEQFRNSPTSENLKLSNYILHLLLLQGFAPSWLHTLLDGSWSIVNEAYFYLLFAGIPTVMWRTSLAAGRLYALSLGSAMFFILAVGRYYDGYSHYGFLAQLPCFILGIIVHRIKLTQNFEKRFAQWNGTVFVTALLLMLGLIKGSSKPLGDSNVYAICFALLLLSSSAIISFVPKILNRMFANFGRQSYSLFLVHLVLLKVWYSLMIFHDLKIDFFFALMVNIIVAFPLAWLISSLFINPIDQYFVARADNWLKRLNFQHPDR